MSGRRGFALLAVLWLTVGLGSLAASALAASRHGSADAMEFVGSARARWAAEGCLNVVQARMVSDGIERALQHAPDTLTFQNGALCASDAVDPGTRIRRDKRGMVARLDSMLQGNGDTTSQARQALLTDLGDGRINVNAASDLVLRALPGFAWETVDEVRRARAWRTPLSSLDDLIARTRGAVRDSLIRYYPQLLGLTGFRPSSLVIVAEGWIASGRPTVTIEAELVSADRRAALTRRRLR